MHHRRQQLAIKDYQKCDVPLHAPMEECFVFIGELVDDARLQMIVGLTPFKTT